MAWIRIDDNFPHHPKVAKAGPLAAHLWLGCLCYSQRYLTDGFIPSAVVASVANVPRPRAHVRRLVEVGLLEVAEGGYRIHDYHDYNASAAEVRADREWDRVRKELYSQPGLAESIKNRDRNRCRWCGNLVNWNDKRSKNGGQFDHVLARGPNTVENLVVACRACNVKKGNRLPADCGMTLLQVPGSEPVPNQVGPSSELNPARARVPIPSHPIPLKKKISDPNNKLPITENRDLSNNAPAARPSRVNGNGHDADANTTELTSGFIAWFHEQYKRDRHGADYLVHRKRDEPTVRYLLKHFPLDRLQKLAQILLSDRTDDTFIEQSDRGISVLKIKANWLNERLSAWEHKNGVN